MPRVLSLTTPTMRGPDVKRVQDKLVALGYVLGFKDSVYGFATWNAVRDFQRDNGLGVDGAVGDDTRGALDAAPVPPQPPPRRRDPPSAEGLAALAEAVTHVGFREGPGEDNTRFGTWYGWNRVAWCNIFLSYCFVEAAGSVLCASLGGNRRPTVIPGKGCAQVQTTTAWLRTEDLWRGKIFPQPGDIAVYNLRGGRQNHIGIVEQDLGNGRFVAIEGNNGDRVKRVTRRLGVAEGFGRV